MRIKLTNFEKLGQVNKINYLFTLEMEEKDNSHLKCPEDTASICSTTVCLFLQSFYY